jgi:Arc/MetJ-type ribon-helix-helix transcriptional regulator
MFGPAVPGIGGHPGAGFEAGIRTPGTPSGGGPELDPIRDLRSPHTRSNRGVIRRGLVIHLRRVPIHGGITVSKMVSLRLEDELAVWAEEYAEAEGRSRSQVINDGLRTLRAAVRKGEPVAVRPPKPPTPSEAEAELVRGREAWALAMSVRQAKLNADKERASR